MKTDTEAIDELVSLLEVAQAQIAEHEERDAPIATIGIACRLPGQANTMAAYAELLAGGRDAITPVPSERWDIEQYFDADPDAPGKMTTRFGGFLSGLDISQFDAQFFGITAKEAQTMDPQQRLLLECVWEALENAGYCPETLRGSRTGVFLGISSSDYQSLLQQRGPEAIDPFVGTGNAHSAAAGRVSYVFGFQGPSKAIDTACSSSLYALHDAVSALRNGECDLAVVAGVNLLLAPEATIYFSKGRFMAPDGRCKTFDAAANGYVRGEGCGVLILKRQRDAQRDGDRVRALVRATAVNQDGRSGGLTVPNGPAQEAVIRAALKGAQVSAADVDYVEAHGTGTPLGDPIEVNALANVYGEGRQGSRPLLIGSAKTNIGHLESAAGMAGLAKIIVSFESEEIPGQLHLSSPNPKIDWDRIPVSVVTRPVAWKRDGSKRRLAGISAFAFQGSNAHAILEEAPVQAALVRTDLPARPYELLVVSAKTLESLALQVAEWAEYLGSTKASLRDVAYTALKHRTQFEHRIAVVANECSDAATKLRAYLRGETPGGLFVGQGQQGSVAVSIESLVALRGSDLADEQSWSSALNHLGQAHVDHRVELATESPLLTDTGGQRVDVPGYAFNRKRHWFEPQRANANNFFELVWKPEEATRISPIRTERSVRIVKGSMATSGLTLAPTTTESVSSGATKVDQSDLVYDVRSVDRVATLDVIEAQCCDFIELWKAVRKTTGARLWLLGSAGSVSAGALVALARVMSLEDRNRFGRAMVLASNSTNERARELLQNELCISDDEEVVSYETGTRRVLRLVEAVKAPASSQWRARNEASYFVSGGLSGLGLEVSKWLVERGAKHLVLAGRRGVVDPSQYPLLSEQDRTRQRTISATLQRMREAGCKVEALALDVAEVEPTRSAFLRLSAERPIDGVFHLAGVGEYTAADQVERTSIHRVLHGKVGGALVLDSLCREHDVKTFVMYGSGAAVWGGYGQGAYAAANGALQTIAQRRRALGEPITLLEWGPIVGGSMANDEAIEQLRRIGMRGLSLGAVHSALADCVGAQTDAIVADFDRERFKAVYEAKGARPLLREISVEKSVTSDGSRAPRKAQRRSSAWADVRRADGATSQREAITQIVVDVVTKTLGGDKQLSLTAGFMDQGIDSLLAVEVRSLLSEALGSKLSATLIFDHPNVSALTEALWLQLFAEHEEESSDFIESRVVNESIAIVGMGCRLPGGIGSPSEFWKLLASGLDATSDVPAGRWDSASVHDPSGEASGTSVTQRGGFVSDIALFDASVFGISAAEAMVMDPQQRMVLECVWQALELANIVPTTLDGTNTAVFVGVTANEYASIVATRAPSTPYAATGISLNSISGRVSYLLGLHGPSIAVDSACSSSLSALHLGCRALSNRETDLVLAGGVNALLSTTSFMMMSRAGALSKDGRCKAFGASADGYGRGEGCGMFVLKRLTDAIADGDQVLAIIKGTSVSHDGRSSSFTAPNGPAQQDTIKNALNRAHLLPSDIDYVEAHGTGTRLGDPIEVQALGAVLSRDREDAKPVMIGTAKTNLGHLESAAGAAGVMKVVLAMCHEVLPRTLHAEPLSPFIPWDELPVVVLTQAQPWVRSETRPRRAGVSSFGISGTNAHVVIEEAPQADEHLGEITARPFELLVLSAKTAEALSLQVSAWAEYLSNTKNALRDVAFTALKHRTQFEHRIAIVAKDCHEAAAALRAFAQGAQPAGLFLGDGREHQSEVSFAPLLATPSNGAAPDSDSAWLSVLSQLARAHVERGVDLGAAAVTGSGGRRVAIPSYVFNRKRYWLDDAVRPGTEARSVGAWLGVEMEFADGGSRRVFTNEVSDEWPLWLKQHRVHDEVVVPATGLIDLMLEVGRVIHGDSVLELREVEINRAMIVRGTLQIQVTYEPSNREVVIHARSKVPNSNWNTYARGTVAIHEGKKSSLRMESVDPMDSASLTELYENLRKRGLGLGPAFQTLRALRPVSDEVILSEVFEESTETTQSFALSPSLLDGCFQGMLANSSGSDLHIPIRFGRIVVWKSKVGERLRTRAEIRSEAGAEVNRGDLWIFDDEGDLVVQISDANTKRVPAEAMRRQIQAQAPDTLVATSLYELQWKAESRQTGKGTALSWLVVSGEREQAFATSYVTALSQQGLSASRCSTEQFQQARTQHKECGVLWVTPRADEANDDTAETVRWRTEQTLKPLLEAAQHLLNGENKTRLCILTEGAQAPAGSGVKRPWQSAVWGFIRVLANEGPELRPLLVDAEDYAQVGSELALELVSKETKEDEIALYGGARYANRLQRYRAKEPVSPTLVSPSGSYLVTGGLGAIGQTLCVWLSEQGAKDIVLLGRGAPSEEAKKKIEQARKNGCVVTIAAVDVTHEAALAKVVAEARARAGRVVGVMHAAGVLQDATIKEQTWAKFERVLAPKAIGVELLSKLVPESEQIECFGSIAAVVGNGGQSNYAAANAYMDGFAQQHSGRVQTTAWWAWAEGGMAKALQDKRSQSTFDKALSMRDGMRLLAVIMGSTCAQPIVFGSEPETLAKQSPERFQAAKYKELVKPQQTGAETEFAKRVRSTPPEERQKLIEARVMQEVSAVLGTETEVDVDQPLMDLGVDSLMAVELRNRFSALVGQTLPSSIVFDFPNIGALAQMLKGRFAGADAPQAVARAIEAHQSDESVAILGMACRLPGKSLTPEALAEMLNRSVDAVITVPSDRWNIEEYYDPDPDALGKMNTRHGGFLQGVDVAQFDAEFFGITPKEAQSMDPQQRLLLECVREAIENAGYRTEELRGSRTGVFLGMGTNDYQSLLYRGGPSAIDPYQGTGNAHSAAAGRVSYVFGFEGPSKSIDTACSSSLYALHDAVNALHNGDCDLAIVAAVNLQLAPELTIYFSKGRFMAPDGHCKSFDASANGYVRGEGCGAIVLRRLGEAQREGNQIRALVRGTAVNQDGRSGGLTVPNGPAQEKVIRDALARAGVSASDVDYVEAHGTGTQLGDPIEMNALSNVYGEGRDQSRPLLVASMKTNIGHLEAAAGIAGLIKLVMAFEGEQLPAQLHLQSPNRKIAWERMAVSVITRPVAWKRNAKKRRLAGISGFAFQGSNAHAILEEAPERTVQPSATRGSELLVLSAKSKEALALQIPKWIEFLQSTGSSLRDVAYTAMKHRSVFEHRIALVARDTADTARQLHGYLAGEPGVIVSDGQEHAGEVDLAQEGEGLSEEARAQTLKTIGESFVHRRADLLTAAMLQGGKRVSVPTYVFNRKRYWMEEIARPSSGSADSNGWLGSEVELAEESESRAFVKEVNEHWPVWLKHHKVQGDVVVPGAGIVELMLEVGRQVHGEVALQLSDVAIERALIVRGSMHVQVSYHRTSGAVVVYARSTKAGTKWTAYARGKVTKLDERRPSAQVKQAESKNDRGAMYAALAQGGLQYGEQFQTLQAVEKTAEGVLSTVYSDQESQDLFVLSPLLLDGVLQSLAVSAAAQSEVYLPIGFGQVRLWKHDAKRLRARAQLQPSTGTEIMRASITLVGEDGELVAELTDATFKRASADALSKQLRSDEQEASSLYELQWKEEARSSEPSKSSGQSWLIVSEESERGFAEGYVSALKARGLRAESCSASDFDKKRAKQGRGYSIVWVSPRADETRANTAETVRWRNEQALKALLQASQALLKESKQAPQLFVLTEGAQAVASQPVRRPWQSAVWGYVRVLANEAPELRPVLIDVHDYSDASNELSWELVNSNQNENEVALYQGNRYVNRLVAYRSRRLIAPSSENWAVMAQRRGQLDSLQLQSVKRERELSERQVEVAVTAVGLNFRDVLNAMGMYPGEAGDLGGDFAGHVSRVGKDVKTVAIGDRVYGLGAGALRKYVVTDERLVTKTPSELSDAQASTLISTFLTVKRGVEEIGKLQKGERVLIHSAAGGVGLAAVQVAHRIGAQIYATASESKHDYLRSLGIAHVYNSRSSEFFEEIQKDTQGQGVDLVLNALTGEKLEKSLKLLRSGGRFVEIGKAELLDAEKVRSINDKATYHAVALDGLALSNPDWFVPAYAALNRDLQSKTYQPLSHAVHAIGQAQEVFRHMAQGKNVGKVVLELKEPELVSKTGSYVISGGLGAIGQELCVWLAEQGAKDIVLLGRSAPSESTKKNIAKAEALGCSVTVAAVDVSDEAALERVMEATRKRAGKVTGIMHAAGVLQDATIKEQSWDKFDQVLTPKAVGIELLNKLGPEAETIQCFGSIAAVIGNGGQANYAAANSYLDGFAQQHPSKAQSTAWWAWAEGGMAKALQDKRSQSKFDKALSMAEGMQLMRTIMSANAVQPVVFAVEPQTLARASPQSFAAAKYNNFVKHQNAREETDLVKSVKATPQAQRQKFIEQRLRQEVRVVLGAEVNIEADQPLMDLGIDSLMAVELRNRLGALVGQTLPSTFVFDHPSLRAMAGALLGTLELSAPRANQAQSIENRVSRDVASLEQSQIADETKAALAALLAKLK